MPALCYFFFVLFSLFQGQSAQLFSNSACLVVHVCVGGVTFCCVSLSHFV